MCVNPLLVTARSEALATEGIQAKDQACHFLAIKIMQVDYCPQTMRPERRLALQELETRSAPLPDSLQDLDHCRAFLRLDTECLAKGLSSLLHRPLIGP